MNHLRMRPKDDYIETARWEELRTLSQQWQSDLVYFRGELRFLNNLIGKYLIWFIREDRLPAVQKMVANLNDLSKQSEQLATALEKQRARIQELSTHTLSEDEVRFRQRYRTLEDNLTDFTKDFRGQKIAISAILEHAIDSQEFQRRISTA